MAINSIPAETRSLKRDVAFWSKIDIRGPDDCWLWKKEKQLSPGGYATASYGDIHTTGHRIAFMLSKGTIPDGHAVLHTCADRYPKGSRLNRRCCNPGHLYSGSDQDNSNDMVRQGRWQRHTRYLSDANPNARISVDRLSDLFTDAKTMSQRQIAAKYGISKSQVGNILRGESRAGILGIMSNEEQAIVLAANARRRKR